MDFVHWYLIIQFLFQLHFLLDSVHMLFKLLYFRVINQENFAHDADFRIPIWIHSIIIHHSDAFSSSLIARVTNANLILATKRRLRYLNGLQATFGWINIDIAFVLLLRLFLYIEMVWQQTKVLILRPNHSVVRKVVLLTVIVLVEIVVFYIHWVVVRIYRFPSVYLLNFFQGWSIRLFRVNALHDYRVLHRMLHFLLGQILPRSIIRAINALQNVLAIQDFRNEWLIGVNFAFLCYTRLVNIMPEIVNRLLVLVVAGVPGMPWVPVADVFQVAIR